MVNPAYHQDGVYPGYPGQQQQQPQFQQQQLQQQPYPTAYNNQQQPPPNFQSLPPNMHLVRLYENKIREKLDPGSLSKSVVAVRSKATSVPNSYRSSSSRSPPPRLTDSPASTSTDRPQTHQRGRDCRLEKKYYFPYISRHNFRIFLHRPTAPTPGSSSPRTGARTAGWFRAAGRGSSTAAASTEGAASGASPPGQSTWQVS